MEEIGRYFFDPAIMRACAPYLLRGLVVTLQLAALVILCGLSLGLALACLRSVQVRAMTLAIVAFADIFRAVPALVVLILVYFALPAVGVSLSPFASSVLALSLVLAAFSEEIFWAGIASVDRGQWEAARSTGLGFGQTLFSVVLGQAIRLVIPPLTNRTIAITKNTALASVVSVEEILNQASSQQALLANPTPLTLGALLYLAIFFPLVVASRLLERRYGRGR